jgi:hypothetical protein
MKELLVAEGIQTGQIAGGGGAASCEGDFAEDCFRSGESTGSVGFRAPESIILS